MCIRDRPKSPSFNEKLPSILTAESAETIEVVIKMATIRVAIEAAFIFQSDSIRLFSLVPKSTDRRDRIEVGVLVRRYYGEI